MSITSTVMKLIEYLKDPQLVASIQQYFGVKIYYDEHFSKLTSYTCSDTSREEENKYISTKLDYNQVDYALNYHDQRINGCDTSNKQSNGANVKQDTNLAQQEHDSMNKHEETCTASKNTHYTITNLFWYYLFLFGTELGDEIFYSTFIPFWFWNIDGAVGLRIVLVWATIMTVGQILKDIICWPRPACPPAVRLQNKWSQEYGMPSTHAMIGVSIPFSVVLFTMNRYNYPFSIGCVIALLWCTLVCMSRLYLGMHTVLDIVAGIVLAIVLMIPLVPLIDIITYYIITNVWVLIVLIGISIVIIVYYPCNDKWTPTRADTAMVVSVTAGVHAGAWLNCATGVQSTLSHLLPYHIIWPTYPMFGRMICRTVLGFCAVIATKILSKFFTYTIMCAILQINSRELMKTKNYSANQNKIFVDLVYKYVACFMIGINTVYLLPNIFSMIGIERPAFYAEI